jgi:repressor LexA
MKLCPTPRQADVLAAIIRLTAEHGFAPTTRELADACGIASTNGVADHLDKLRARGWITWERTKSRTLRVLP